MLPWAGTKLLSPFRCCPRNRRPTESPSDDADSAPVGGTPSCSSTPATFEQTMTFTGSDGEAPPAMGGASEVDAPLAGGCPPTGVVEEEDGPSPMGDTPDPSHKAVLILKPWNDAARKSSDVGDATVDPTVAPPHPRFLPTGAGTAAMLSLEELPRHLLEPTGRDVTAASDEEGRGGDTGPAHGGHDGGGTRDGGDVSTGQTGESASCGVGVSLSLSIHCDEQTPTETPTGSSIDGPSPTSVMELLVVPANDDESGRSPEVGRGGTATADNETPPSDVPPIVPVKCAQDDPSSTGEDGGASAEEPTPPSAHDADVASHLYEGAKGIWAWSKSHIPLAHVFMGLTEAVATTVTQAASGGDLHELDRNLIQPQLAHLDGGLLNPAIHAVLGIVFHQDLPPPEDIGGHALLKSDAQERGPQGCGVVGTAAGA